MTHLFVDANILVAVLNKEYPLFSYAARILSLADHRNYRVYTSPLCLTIAFYFSEKKSGRKVALRKIRLLSEKLLISSMDASTVARTIQNPAIHDFEDGLEYFSALDASCRYIISENPQDFYFSDIPIEQSASFLRLISTNKNL
jgi:predicted nucleic acid-binding protein